MAATAWRDRHGDVWREAPDGMMHTPETRPFTREHVERKWGPLEPVDALSLCPECEQGKCGNCDGSAWHEDLDTLSPCGCPDPSHA